MFGGFVITLLFGLNYSYHTFNIIRCLVLKMLAKCMHKHIQPSVLYVQHKLNHKS